MLLNTLKHSLKTINKLNKSRFVSSYQPDREFTPPDEGTKIMIDRLVKYDTPKIEVTKLYDQVRTQISPNYVNTTLCRYSYLQHNEYSQVIKQALAGKDELQELGVEGRIEIFNKVYQKLDQRGESYQEILASIIVGQGKTYWEAILDLDEFLDFLHFNVKYYREILAEQPPDGPSPTISNRIEYNPLNGFVTAITPFNFTAIGGNLASLPVLLGNSVIWKPSPQAIHSNWLVHQQFLEAGLPPNSLQFVPDHPDSFMKNIVLHPKCGGCSFTGSTMIFDEIQEKIGDNTRNYNQNPRLIGETGGKNFHFAGRTASCEYVVEETIKSAFGYSGQKCSACSLLLIPKSRKNEYYAEFKKQMPKYTVGNPELATTENPIFMGSVINRKVKMRHNSIYSTIMRDNRYEMIYYNPIDDNKMRNGYYCSPIVFTNNDHKLSSLKNPLMTTEHFLPILGIYTYNDHPYFKYDDNDNRDISRYQGYKAIFDTLKEAHPYGLTGSLFSNDEKMIETITEMASELTGNFYVNRKSTGSVVGYQPFGGGRKSGTNDKVGWKTLLYRFMNLRTISTENNI